jgi:hypothetical protein
LQIDAAQEPSIKDSQSNKYKDSPASDRGEVIAMILRDYETIIRKERAQLFDSTRDKSANGILYLINTRLIFELENGVEERSISLDRIHSMDIIDEYNFKISYKGATGPPDILTDIYKIIGSGGNNRDWLRDFKKLKGIRE